MFVVVVVVVVSFCFALFRFGFLCCDQNFKANHPNLSFPEVVILLLPIFFLALFFLVLALSFPCLVFPDHPYKKQWACSGFIFRFMIPFVLFHDCFTLVFSFVSYLRSNESFLSNNTTHQQHKTHGKKALLLLWACLFEPLKR